MISTPILSDKIREYWNRRPCNIRHSNQKIGSKEYFDQVEARKYFVEPHIPEFAEFEKWRGKKVLEIGCGIGTDTINFSRAGAQVTAIDLSEKSLEIAHKRSEVNNQNIKFYQGNAEDLDKIVPVEPYDLIYSFGAIHHAANPEQILNQIKKYTSPNTVIKIMVYHKFSWKVLRILLVYGKGCFWKISGLISKHSEAETGCPVTYAYSKSSIRKLMEKCGLRVKETKVEHVFPYSIPEYKNYKYKVVWYFRWMPAWMFRSFEKIAGWHLLVTACQ